MKKKIFKLDKSSWQFVFVFYKILIASFIAACLGNIGYEIFLGVFKNQGNPYLALALVSRFTVPFFLVLIFAFYSFIKNGFNKYLRFDKQNIVIWLLILFGASIISAFLMVINVLNNFLTHVMLDTIVWFAMVSFFSFLFAVAYSLAVYFLMANPKKESWLLLLKTLLNLIIIPVFPGVLMDFVWITLLIVLSVLNVGAELPSYSVIIIKIARLIYPIFVLCYFIKYKDKDFKKAWVKVAAYLMIILFILEGLMVVLGLLGI